MTYFIIVVAIFVLTFLWKLLSHAKPNEILQEMERDKVIILYDEDERRYDDDDYGDEDPFKTYEIIPNKVDRNKIYAYCVEKGRDYVFDQDNIIMFKKGEHVINRMREEYEQERKQEKEDVINRNKERYSQLPLIEFSYKNQKGKFQDWQLFVEKISENTFTGFPTDNDKKHFTFNKSQVIAWKNGTEKKVKIQLINSMRRLLCEE